MAHVAASVVLILDALGVLTGDENIVNIHFSVFWRKSDAQKYLFSIQNPDKLFLPSKENVSTAVEGMATKKGNPEALAVLNEWIGKNKDWLKERHTYWFKTREWAANVPVN